jgi:hypothetical protein
VGLRGEGIDRAGGSQMAKAAGIVRRREGF